MKWFKHMTGSADDEKMARLLDIAGLEGYGFYWRIIEIIAAQIEKDTDKFQVKYSQNRLGILTLSHGNKVRKLLGNLQETGLITVEKTEENNQIFYSLGCRNILKYRDEWTSRISKTREQLGSKSGATPEEIQNKESNTETDTESEEIKKKKHFAYSEEFERFWAEYPKKEGKSGAFKKWNARIKEKANPELIIMAAIKYSEMCRDEGREAKYIRAAERFLNPDWPDALEYKSKPVENIPPHLKGLAL